MTAVRVPRTSQQLRDLIIGEMERMGFPDFDAAFTIGASVEGEPSPRDWDVAGTLPIEALPVFRQAVARIRDAYPWDRDRPGRDAAMG